MSFTELKWSRSGWRVAEQTGKLGVTGPGKRKTLPFATRKLEGLL
jgi:hypothetical protein